jgi:hypothetical protein
MKRRKAKPERDPFLSSRTPKGTPITVRVEPELIKLLDGMRDAFDQESGILHTRAETLEGLLRRITREERLQAIVLGGGVGAHLKGGADDE